jgi:hypothetical protein
VSDRCALSSDCSPEILKRYSGVYVYACVCVSVSVREREGVCVCMYMRVCV